MTRIEQILRAVRYSTADPNKERYSDARILEAISDGQKDIARQTRLLKDTTTLNLVAGKAIYDLPSDVWLVHRATVGGEAVPFMSHETMDTKDKSWSGKVGSKALAIVYDKRNILAIRVYPILDSSYRIYKYTIVSDVPADNELPESDKLILDELYAELGPAIAAGDIEHVKRLTCAISTLGNFDDTVFGVTTSFGGGPYLGFGVLSTVERDCSLVELRGQLGVVTEAYATTGELRIDYIKDPASIVSVADELLVPPLFDAALKHFAIASVYSDDLDTQYQIKANSAMALYQRELDTVGYPSEFQDSTMATQYNAIDYVGPFQ